MKSLSIVDALISIQTALLGVVTPALRAVIVDYNPDEEILFVRFYYDGSISEDLEDLWQCAITEASAHLGPDCFVDEGVERLDYPQKIPRRDRYAYLRKE